MPREKLTAESCRSCGMCCVAFDDQEVFANVTPADEPQLGKRIVRLHVLDGALRTQWRRQRSGPFSGWEMNTCRMLQGSVGSRVSCRIYERRPRCCHVAVKPGDRVCREVRRIMREGEPEV